MCPLYKINADPSPTKTASGDLPSAELRLYEIIWTITISGATTTPATST
jgi:hypothetical protein